MIKENLGILQNRIKVPIYEEIETADNQKKIKHKFYKCDYCGDKIYILKQHHKMTGGTLRVSQSYTHSAPVELASCNKCVKKIYQEFE